MKKLLLILCSIILGIITTITTSVIEINYGYKSKAGFPFSYDYTAHGAIESCGSQETGKSFFETQSECPDKPFFDIAWKPFIYDVIIWAIVWIGIIMILIWIKKKTSDRPKLFRNIIITLIIGCIILFLALRFLFSALG